MQQLQRFAFPSSARPALMHTNCAHWVTASDEALAHSSLGLMCHGWVLLWLVAESSWDRRLILAEKFIVHTFLCM
jgi:hypothetical protein